MVSCYHSSPGFWSIHLIFFWRIILYFCMSWHIWRSDICVTFLLLDWGHYKEQEIRILIEAKQFFSINTKKSDILSRPNHLRNSMDKRVWSFFKCLNVMFQLFGLLFQSRSLTTKWWWFQKEKGRGTLLKHRIIWKKKKKSKPLKWTVVKSFILPFYGKAFCFYATTTNFLLLSPLALSCIYFLTFPFSNLDLVT